MTMESWEYGNPETIAIRREEDALRKAKACGNCVHVRSVEFHGEVGMFCEFKRRTYGRRCDLFEPTKGTDARK